MARKGKKTEPAPFTLQTLPRDTEELTTEEAVAAKGGSSVVYGVLYGVIEGVREAEQDKKRRAMMCPIDR
jgi:hypothetical protein